jgi:hypothetical protein
MRKKRAVAKCGKQKIAQKSQPRAPCATRPNAPNCVVIRALATELRPKNRSRISPPKSNIFKKIGKKDGRVRVPKSTPAYQKLGSYDERGPSYGQKTFLGPDRFGASPRTDVELKCSPGLVWRPLYKFNFWSFCHI